MKCPNCGQEIIDKKVFCPNCGKQLNNIDNSGFNPKKIFALFVLVMIVLGVGTIYIIANVGTDKELNEIIKPNKEIVDFYDSYIIKDIVYTDDSNKDIKEKEDDIIGFETEFKSDSIKLGIPPIKWVRINNPTIKEVKEIEKYQRDLDDGIIKVISIEGNNDLGFNEKTSIKMIKTAEKTFIYYLDTYFEIKPSTYGFASVNKFYKVNTMVYKYNDNINKILKEYNNNIKKDVESNTVGLYENNYEEIIDGDVTHIVMNKITGNLYSETYIVVTTLSFDSTGKILNLKDYIEHIGKDYNEFIINYEKEKQKISDYIGKNYETTPDLMYYVKDNKIIIVSSEDSYGSMLIEMEK